VTSNEDTDEVLDVEFVGVPTTDGSKVSTAAPEGARPQDAQPPVISITCLEEAVESDQAGDVATGGPQDAVQVENDHIGFVDKVGGRIWKGKGPGNTIVTTNTQSSKRKKARWQKDNTEDGSFKGAYTTHKKLQKRLRNDATSTTTYEMHDHEYNNIIGLFHDEGKTFVGSCEDLHKFYYLLVFKDLFTP